MTDAQDNHRNEEPLPLRHGLFRGIAVFLLLVLGTWYAVWQWRVHDGWMRQTLLSRARLMAEAINIDRMTVLAQNPEPLSEAHYARLKGQVAILKEINPDLDVVYLLGRSAEGQPYVIMSSDPGYQPDYLKPGYVYKEMPVALRQGQDKWRAAVEGPQADRQGVWMSALVPINNTMTGEPLASLGVRLDARAWNWTLMQQVLPGILTTFLLIGIILAGARLWAHRHRLGESAPRCLLCVEPATVLMFGVCLSLFAGWHFYQAEHRRCQESFWQLAQVKTKEMADSIRLIRSQLNALEKFVATREEVGAEEFRLFCQAFGENSLVWGWCWAPQVKAGELESFVAEVRRRGVPDFEIWQRNRQGERIPLDVREVHYPVLYVAPHGGRQPVTGFDVYSEPLRRAALRAAVDSGMPAASDPVGLIYAVEAPLGLLAFRPVFRCTGAGDVAGVVFAAIEAESLVNPYKHHHDAVHMDLRLCGPGGHSRKLATCPYPAPCDFGIASLTRPMFAFGKVFALTAHPGPLFMQGYPIRRQAAKTAVMGMALSLAVAIIIKLIIRRGYELEHLVAARTTELGESEVRFNELAEKSRTVLWRVDAAGLFTYVSPISAEVYGYPAGELMHSRHYCELHPESGRAEFREKMAAVWAQGRPFNDVIHPLQTKSGRLVMIATSGVPLLDAVGRVAGYHGSDKDVSEREEMMAELRRSQAAAEAANRAKSEFLANMSHEIRTPINGVIGVTDMLQESALDHEQRHLVEIINGSGKLLLVLINDILDFSRIEAGKVDLHPVDFDVDDLLSGLCGGLALRAQEKGVELVLDVHSAVPRWLRGDNLRLLEILMNLAGNAVKFTERGQVVLSVRLEKLEGGCAEVQFSVKDSGIGIAEDQFQFLFEAFYQGDSSIRRKHGGTGLGLPIARRLTECMGGKMSFSSELGVGSEFRFSLPLSVVEQGGGSALALPAGAAGVRVLVVDDNLAVRLNVSELLEAQGMAVSMAGGVAEAMALSRQAAARGEPFRLAVIDGELPGEGALPVATALRQESAQARLRVLAMFALGCRTEESMLTEVGIDGVVRKPISRPALAKAVCSVLFGPAAAAAVVPQAGCPGSGSLAVAAEVKAACEAGLPVAGGGGPEILLVEDNSTNQKVALLILKRLGLRAEVAGNGLEALKLLAENDYQAILMDIQMPEMDGFAATRCIRDPSSQVRNRNIPIIAMTAHAMDGYRQDCQRAGMDDYISKPVTPKQMREVLSRWIPDLPVGSG